MDATNLKPSLFKNVRYFNKSQGVSVFAFPQAQFNDRGSFLPPTTKQQIRCNPLRSAARSDPSEDGPLQLFQHIGKVKPDNPYIWRAKEMPTTAYLTAVYKDPLTIINVMIERSKMDMSFFSPLPYETILEKEDVVGMEGAIYRGHPLLMLKGQHMWRPGEVLATPYGAEKMIPALELQSMMGGGPLEAISPRAALLAQRIEPRELHWLMSCIYAREGWGEYMPTEGKLRSALALSGGLGGAPADPIGTGGSLITNWPLLSLSPIASISIARVNHTRYALSYRMGQEDSVSVHEAHLRTLATAELDHRCSRFKKLKERFLTWLGRHQATSVNHNGVPEGALLEELHRQVENISCPEAHHYSEAELAKMCLNGTYASQAIRDAYGHLKEKCIPKVRAAQAQTVEFMRSVANSEPLFRKACEQLVKDEFVMDIAMPHNDLRNGMTTLAQRNDLGIKVWLYFLTYHYYIGPISKRLRAKELMAISWVTGIPVTKFVAYYINFERRTGFWLGPKNLTQELIQLVKDREDDGRYSSYCVDMEFPLRLQYELEDLEVSRTAMGGDAVRYREFIARKDKISAVSLTDNPIFLAPNPSNFDAM